jgi:hypothetical protein
MFWEGHQFLVRLRARVAIASANLPHPTTFTRILYPDLTATPYAVNQEQNRSFVTRCCEGSRTLWCGKVHMRDTLHPGVADSLLYSVESLITNQELANNCDWLTAVDVQLYGEADGSKSMSGTTRIR